MVEVKLIIYSGADSREFQMTGDELSLGRGDVTLSLRDQGLSYLHATIHRDQDRVWILDEGSTNGTSVNGVVVPPSGSPLKDGDEIAIGNDTDILVRIFKPHTGKAVGVKATSLWGDSQTVVKYWPVAAVAAVMIVVIAVFALSRVGSATDEKSENQPPIYQPPPASPTISLEPTAPSEVIVQSPGFLPSPPISSDLSIPIRPVDKTYRDMDLTERRGFIQREAEKVAHVIGNRGGEAVTPEAVETIMGFVKGYASRAQQPKLNAKCNGGNWLRFDLTSVLERGQASAPFIIRAFNEKGLDPQLGLYLAMIESEYCVCLQSNTGPLGMFQFTTRTAQSFGLQAVAGRSPSNPDERCEPDKAARAAAAYVKFLIGRYGTGPLSVPLAIASYNSGEGMLSSNLSTAMTNAMQEERSFWTLVANKGKLSDQFKRENVRYVPKFFAAAIIGENPQIFGVSLQRISSYDH